jgi:hypothetical protein
LVIDCAELVQQQIGILPKFALGRNSETEWFRCLVLPGSVPRRELKSASQISPRLRIKAYLNGIKLRVDAHTFAAHFM